VSALTVVRWLGHNPFWLLMLLAGIAGAAAFLLDLWMTAKEVREERERVQQEVDRMKELAKYLKKN
jgi:hypothetical protein